jgi:hypothetical protein
MAQLSANSGGLACFGMTGFQQPAGGAATCPTCGVAVRRRGRRGPLPTYCGQACRQTAYVGRRSAAWQSLTPEQRLRKWAEGQAEAWTRSGLPVPAEITQLLVAKTYHPDLLRSFS